MSFRDEYDSREGITGQEPDPQEGGTDGYEELAEADSGKIMDRLKRRRGMKAEEFLYRPREVRRRLEEAEQRAAALKALTERMTARFGIEAEAAGHTGNTDRMQEAIINLVEAKEEAARLKEELAGTEMETGMVLAEIPDEPLREFMIKRYLDLMTIRTAAEELNYSYTWGQRANRRGIAEVQGILDCNGQ